VSRLLSVELRRFFARRLTRWSCVALMLGIAAIGIGTFATNSNDVAAAHRSAARAAQQFAQSQQQARQQCVATVPADQVDQNCGTDEPVPTADAFYRDPRFSFHDHVRDLLTTGCVIGSLVGLILAASLIGAEWQAGTFASLLTWEPRRLRVATTKVAAVIVGSLAVMTIATALLLGVESLVAATHGTFASVLQDRIPQPRFAEQTWAMAGRGALVVMLVTAMGAALALLLRHTVAALGVAIGYFIVGEGIIGSLRHADIRHHLLQSRLDALLNGRYEWPIPIREPDGGIGFSPQHIAVVHALTAGVEALVVVAALLLVAMTVLHRRDVT
jgi:ABC-2 type transport system permease protein